MNTIAKWLTALALLSVPVMWTGTAVAKDPPILSLTMEHFRDTATLKDDALDTTAIITTEPGLIDRGTFFRPASYDEFFRVFIDKRTGARIFQVYEWHTYSGSSWHFYETANFATPTGPVSVPVTKVASNLEGCTANLGCTYTEHVAFTVDEALLRQLASTYAPGHNTVWLYKFIAKDGTEFEDGFTTAEIAGVLAKVDEYTNAHPVAGGISAKPAFGVVLVPLPPSADQPQRVGLLIVQVKSGSVAERAGVQVGDIMTEFAGTALKQNADLQTAFATVSPGASVDLKLIRGAADLKLTAQF
jgi:hypothetical protein